MLVMLLNAKSVFDRVLLADPCEKALLGYRAGPENPLMGTKTIKSPNLLFFTNDSCHSSP